MYDHKTHTKRTHNGQCMPENKHDSSPTKVFSVLGT